MSEIAISVENLSKMYRIGREERQPQNAWEAVKSLAGSPFAYLRRTLHPLTEEERLWALKDISFDMKQGEVVGIIGRNGAGKSTLLRILSRITEPTSGRAEIYGRVGSLLEVGTGFHPELTGRENIYLNGAILGMRRHEIERKFDEIVAFAEINRFLDTPVKRYSSGMYVRLAFAVAAHLESEILLVDEVLAVGDAAFQKKCLGKMESVAGEGRTVLFVSHNMAAVRNLCARSLLIKDGKIDYIGDTETCVGKYLDISENLQRVPIADRKDRVGSGTVKVTELAVDPEPILPTGTCTFRVQLSSNRTTEVEIGIGINTLENQPLLLFFSGHSAESVVLEKGTQDIECFVDSLPLAPGVYSVNLCIQKGPDIYDWIREAAQIEVAAEDFFDSGRLPVTGQVPFLLHHKWRTEK